MAVQSRPDLVKRAAVQVLGVDVELVLLIVLDHDNAMIYCKYCSGV